MLLQAEAIILSNKAAFITEILDGTLDLRRKKTAEVRMILKEKAYTVIDGDENYKYLVRLPMDSVAEENVDKLLQEKAKKEHELDCLRKTTTIEMWLNELRVLREQYVLYKEKRNNETQPKGRKMSGKKKKKLKVNMV